MAESIELKPSRAGYIQMLTVIIESSSKPADIRWAKAELLKFADVCSSCNGDGLNHPYGDIPEIVEDEPCEECQGFS